MIVWVAFQDSLHTLSYALSNDPCIDFISTIMAILGLTCSNYSMPTVTERATFNDSSRSGARIATRLFQKVQ